MGLRRTHGGGGRTGYTPGWANQIGGDGDQSASVAARAGVSANRFKSGGNTNAMGLRVTGNRGAAYEAGYDKGDGNIRTGGAQLRAALGLTGQCKHAKTPGQQRQQDVGPGDGQVQRIRTGRAGV